MLSRPQAHDPGCSGLSFLRVERVMPNSCSRIAQLRIRAQAIHGIRTPRPDLMRLKIDFGKVLLQTVV